MELEMATVFIGAVTILNTVAVVYLLSDQSEQWKRMREHLKLTGDAFDMIFEMKEQFERMKMKLWDKETK